MLSPMELDWIPVPGGRFWMGGGPRDNENPRHEVRVPAFRLARAPVTRAEYQRFLDETGREAPPFWQEPELGHPKMPAVGPSWEDAAAYCAWLNGRTGEAVRLPSEAEWEHAARAGRDVLYRPPSGAARQVEHRPRRRSGPARTGRDRRPRVARLPTSWKPPAPAPSARSGQRSSPSTMLTAQSAPARRARFPARRDPGLGRDDVGHLRPRPPSRASTPRTRMAGGTGRDPGAQRLVLDGRRASRQRLALLDATSREAPPFWREPALSRPGMPVGPSLGGRAGPA